MVFSGALCGIFASELCVNFRGGRASAPAGVAPEALEECVHSCKGYKRFE